MKITYAEFVKAVTKADAVTVDGNLTFPNEDLERIYFVWTDESAQIFEYYIDEESVTEDDLTITVGKDGAIKVNGMVSADDDVFQPGSSIIRLLKHVSYHDV